MKLLAIDSSGLVASVAVIEEETLVAEYTMNYKKHIPRLASDVRRNKKEY